MLIRSRRPKRNRYLQIGLFFIIYTCYHAYSAAVGDPTNEETRTSSAEVVDDDIVKFTTESSDVSHAWDSELKNR